ncbi:MAG: phosphate ABC transporter permease PstA [Verrucomicrobia bacterium]|nr:phosphate ABC transporter permease PstA [Verrucomicrobiota bacterium]
MSATTVTPPMAQPKPLGLKSKTTRDQGRLASNTFWTGVCTILSFLTLVPLFSIVFLVLKEGTPLLTPSIFTDLPPAPGLDGGGFGNAIQGTLVMVVLALLISTPLGILSAIYICEYSRRSRLSSTVRFIAKLLTGIPSIICGVFAFAVVVLTMGHFSAIAGGIALAVLTLPTILLTSEQALLGVANALREASYGIGATKFQTITRVVLPEALPAIMTGLMLAVARAAGETAPVLFTAQFSFYWLSNFFPNPVDALSQPTASLSVLIYNFATLPYAHQIQMAWTASLVLVILVTITNITAQLVFSKRGGR